MASRDDSRSAKGAAAPPSLVQPRLAEPSLFRAALLRVPPAERDGWVDARFGLGELPVDGPELPRGCVPYLPCAVDTLLRVVDEAPVGPTDVFVDIGAGLGRAAALVHLLTGATVIGLEIQGELLRAANELVRRLALARVSFVGGDAAVLPDVAALGSVFFLYCPFSGERLARVLGMLEAIARTRSICICTVDLPLPACPWLGPPATAPPGDLVIYRSR